MTVRREFLFALSALTAAPGFAQSVKQARVGVLSASSPRSVSFYQAFDRRLRELGWIEGSNLIVEFRTAAADERRFASLAAELAGLRCDVIVAGGPEALLAALKEAASPIPIVALAVTYDPVRRGYAASLARPGGNITGISFLAPEVEAKRLDLLHEALPDARKFAVLWDEHTFDARRSAEDAARKLGLELVLIENRPPYDYDALFAQVRATGASGVLAVRSPRTVRDRKLINEAALKHRMPVISALPMEQLLAFGPNFDKVLTDVAEYVDRILKGARPGELSIEQPTAFDLVINLKTAKAIGVPIPKSMLLRASRLIE
jgi:putative ABC transport system substrate-binding protein